MRQLIQVRVHKGEGVPTFTLEAQSVPTPVTFLPVCYGYGSCSIPAQIILLQRQGPAYFSEACMSPFSFSGLPCAASVKASSCASTGNAPLSAFSAPLRRRLVRYLQTITFRVRYGQHVTLTVLGTRLSPLAIVHLERLF